MALDMLSHALLSLALVSCCGAAAKAQPAAVQPIAISVDAPARVGFPIWVHANLRGDLIARYPYQEDPRYFGSNRLELKRDGQVLAAQRGYSSGGLVGRVEGSAAPPTSPRNRLPLHVGFVIDRPGRYSVRWSVIGSDVAPGVLAESEWLDFDVVASPPAAHEAWLTDVLRAPPIEPGAFVGDYLPSLLAAVPDPRVAQAVMDATYSSSSWMTSCALASLRLFPADVMVPLTMRTLHARGPNNSLAYFVSWNASWFQDRRDEIVRMAESALSANDDAILVGALQFLNFAPHFDWLNDAPLRDVARAVKAAAPRMMSRSEDVARQLAVTLGGTRDPDVRPLLTEIATKHPAAREQAMIAMRWISEPVPPLPERTASPLSEAVTKLESAVAGDRKSGAEMLLSIARASPEDRVNVGAYLVNDVIRQPRSVSADTWYDAALILGRVQSPAALALTVYLERDGAATALIESGNVVTAAMIDVLKVGGETRRRLAAQVLGAIGGAAGWEALNAALKIESDVRARRAIEDALVRFGERPPPTDIR